MMKAHIYSISFRQLPCPAELIKNGTFMEVWMCTGLWKWKSSMYIHKTSHVHHTDKHVHKVNSSSIYRYSADVRKKTTTPLSSLKIGTKVTNHVLIHTLKGFPVASSSLAARVENDDIWKIDDPFDFGLNRHLGSTSRRDSYPKRISRCIQ